MKDLQKEIKLPEGITATHNNSLITLSHQNKSVSRDLGKEKVRIEIKEQKIVLHADKHTKREHALLNSLVGHIQNMIDGLEKPFEYKLAIVYSHFPMTISVKEGWVEIHNFMGGKKTRKSRILQGTQVEVKEKEIIVKSHDKERAGQTAANLENATRVIGKDRRVYQDGIFIVAKPEKKMGETRG